MEPSFWKMVSARIKGLTPNELVGLNKENEGSFIITITQIKPPGGGGDGDHDSDDGGAGQDDPSLPGDV